MSFHDVISIVGNMFICWHNVFLPFLPLQGRLGLRASPQPMSIMCRPQIFLCRSGYVLYEQIPWLVDNDNKMQSNISNCVSKERVMNNKSFIVSNSQSQNVFVLFRYISSVAKNFTELRTANMKPFLQDMQKPAEIALEVSFLHSVCQKKWNIKKTEIHTKHQYIDTYVVCAWHFSRV